MATLGYIILMILLVFVATFMTFATLMALTSKKRAVRKQVPYSAPYSAPYSTTLNQGVTTNAQQQKIFEVTKQTDNGDLTAWIQKNQTDYGSTLLWSQTDNGNVSGMQKNLDNVPSWSQKDNNDASSWRQNDNSDAPSWSQKDNSDAPSWSQKDNSDAPSWSQKNNSDAPLWSQSSSPTPSGYTRARPNMPLSSQLASRLSRVCDANRQQYPYSSSTWDRFPFSTGFWGTGPFGERTSTGRDQIASMPSYGGTCLWCPPGRTWDSIPLNTPLPYQGTQLQQTNPQTIGPNTNPSDLLQVTSLNLPSPAVIILDMKGPIRDCAGETLAMSVQPNGGIQVAYQENGTGLARILYLSPDLKITDTFTVPAESVGGIIAIGNNGTALFISQRDCEAPAITNWSMAPCKAVVSVWRDGQLQWSTQVTNPYAKSTSNKTDDQGNPIGIDEEEDPDAQGSFVGFLAGSQFLYHAPSGRLAAYYKVTSNSGHWGSRMSVLFAQDGKILAQVDGISHEISSRIVAEADFPLLAICDCVAGIARPIQLRAQQRGIPIDNWTFSPENHLAYNAGWASSMFGSFLPRPSDKGYIAAFLSKRDALFMGAYIILADTKIIAQNRYAYPGNDRGKIEFFNMHLTPIKDAQRELYLMSYCVKDMQQAMSFCFEQENKENRCPAPIQKQMFQVIEVRGDVIFNVGVAQEDTKSVWMQSSVDPIVDPSTGDVWWLSPDQKRIQPNGLVYALQTEALRVVKLPTSLVNIGQGEQWPLENLPPPPASHYSEIIPNPAAPKKLLALGDVWTEGQYADFTTAADSCTPYTDRLQTLLGSSWSVQNMARSVDSLQSMKYRLFIAMQNAKQNNYTYDVAVVWGGLMETTFFTWTDVDFRNLLESLCSELRKNGINKILLVTMPKHGLEVQIATSQPQNTIITNRISFNEVIRTHPGIAGVVDVANDPQLQYTPTLFGSRYGLKLPPAFSARVGDMVYATMQSLQFT